MSECTWRKLSYYDNETYPEKEGWYHVYLGAGDYNYDFFDGMNFKTEVFNNRKPSIVCWLDWEVPQAPFEELE